MGGLADGHPAKNDRSRAEYDAGAHQQRHAERVHERAFRRDPEGIAGVPADLGGDLPGGADRIFVPMGGSAAGNRAGLW